MSDTEEISTRNELLLSISEILLLEPSQIMEHTVLSDLGPVWDSIAMIHVLVMLNSKSSQPIAINDLLSCDNVSQIIDLVVSS